MENNPNSNPQSVQLSPAIQQKLQLINVRVNDLMLTLNEVVTVLLKENQQLRAQVEQSKPPTIQTPTLEVNAATQEA